MLSAVDADQGPAAETAALTAREIEYVVCMYRCMSECRFVYIYEYYMYVCLNVLCVICMHVCMCACMYVCKYVCMYVRMYVCMHL